MLPNILLNNNKISYFTFNNLFQTRNFSNSTFKNQLKLNQQTETQSFAPNHQNEPETFLLDIDLDL